MTMTTDTSGLPAPLSRALAAKGYDTLTEVQSAMLDEGLSGRDLLVSAQTGSGKTVAFGLAMGPDLMRGQDRLPRAGVPLALVVAPTRELAMQVARELTWLYAETGAAVATCVGGMDLRRERQALDRGAHIVVGTPGRLVDHISHDALDLSALRVAILDEADEMLKLGFREELEAILEACSEERRTLMFSATVGGGIGKLAAQYQRDALRISASGPARSHDDIAYKAMVTAQHDAEKAIINTLRFHEAENAIVFCGTRAAVARLTSRLANRGFSVVSLSGELSQQERTNALQAMRDGRARVCVATDVAARGIDLPGLELVIHADLPKDREGLLHRSGRTGRAGRKGTSVLVVPPRARRRVEQLFRDAKVDADWIAPPSAEAVLARDDARLLSDPILNEGGEADALAQTLSEAYSAEHLAAAFIRLHRQNRSAPEEITELAVAPPGAKKVRTEITDAAWVVLSVGRAHRAEPRWLLPMLCKSGPVPKGAIGAIRVRETETYVQLDAQGAADFLSGLGTVGRLEDGIEVRRTDGPPAPEGPREASAPVKSPRKPRASRDGKPRSTGSFDPLAPTPDRGTGEAPRFTRKPKAKGKPGVGGGKPGGPKPRQTGPGGSKPPKRPKKRSS
jgi:ATP-dependent RNA helicase DeaD